MIKLNTYFHPRGEIKKEGEKFYKAFIKSGISSYKKDIVSVWVRTSKVLRILFKSELLDKCKNCSRCCCRDCKTEFGYFSSFDYFIYKLRKLELPNKKDYLGKKGCSLGIDRRSFTCLFYSCGLYPLVQSIKYLWEFLIKDLEKSIKEKSSYGNIYDIITTINYNLTEIENKYNPKIEINTNYSLKEHSNNFKKLFTNKNILTEEMQNSIKFINTLLDLEMIKRIKNKNKNEN